MNVGAESTDGNIHNNQIYALRINQKVLQGMIFLNSIYKYKIYGIIIIIYVKRLIKN